MVFITSCTHITSLNKQVRKTRGKRTYPANSIFAALCRQRFVKTRKPMCEYSKLVHLVQRVSRTTPENVVPASAMSAQARDWVHATHQNLLRRTFYLHPLAAAALSVVPQVAHTSKFAGRAGGAVERPCWHGNPGHGLDWVLRCWGQATGCTS